MPVDYRNQPPGAPPNKMPGVGFAPKPNLVPQNYGLQSEVDPTTGLPKWDPRNNKVNVGFSYLNQLRRPSEGVDPGLQRGIQSAAARGLTDPAGTRHIPGSGVAMQARVEQLGAARGVAGAGQDFRGMQMDAAQGALMRGAPGANLQAHLAQQSNRLGQPEAVQQQQLAGMLRQSAMGTGGPSAAEIMAQRMTDRSASQQAGMAAGVRGGNAAAAMRQAGIANQGDRANAAQAAMQMRAEEQLAARGQLGGVLQGMRGQAIDTFGARGDLAAQMRGQGLNEALGQGQLAGQGRDADLQRALGSVGALGAVRQQDLGQQGLELGARGMDDAERQAEFGRAIAGGQFGAGLGQMDNAMMFQGQQQVGDFMLGRRAGDIQREALPSGFERGMDAAAPFVSATGTFFGGMARPRR